MKQLLFSIALITVFSCGEQTNSSKDENTLTDLRTYEKENSEEQNTAQFVEDYINALNTKDWKTNIDRFLLSDSEAFLEQHRAFRESFPNYKTTIKHMVVEGNEVILWINCTANYESTYTFEDTYIHEVFQGIEAKNQSLSWDETWYFDVVDGRFEEKWDFLKDNLAVLEGLEVDTSL